MAVIAFFFGAPDAANPTKGTFREKLLNMDILGIATIMCAVVCYLLALQKAGVTYAWNSSMVVGLLVGSAIFFIIFVAIQLWLGERAMLVTRLLKDRTVYGGMIYIFFLAGSSWLFVY